MSEDRCCAELIKGGNDKQSVMFRDQHYNYEARREQQEFSRVGCLIQALNGLPFRMGCLDLISAMNRSEGYVLVYLISRIYERSESIINSM